jgi:hypothetical protein
MGVKIGLAVIGLLNVLSGLFMLVLPVDWFHQVIGEHVAMGPMDTHFIRDIGFAFLASGVGMGWGLRRGAAAGAFALAGSVWPMLHALFHLDLWAMHGMPHGQALISEGVGVIAISTLGAIVGWLRFRQGDT